MPNDTIFHRIICCINVNHIMLLPYSDNNIAIELSEHSGWLTNTVNRPSHLPDISLKGAQCNPMFLH